MPDADKLPGALAATPAILAELHDNVLGLYLGAAELYLCRSVDEVAAELRNINALGAHAGNVALRDELLVWFRRAYSARHPRAKLVDGLHPSYHDKAFSVAFRFVSDLYRDHFKAARSIPLVPPRPLLPIDPAIVLQVSTRHSFELDDVRKVKGQLGLEASDAANLCVANSGTTPTVNDCYVVLKQMGAIVNRGKRTLEGLVTQPGFPPPAVKGGGGRPNEWLWSQVRPHLEKKYKRSLPEVFPSAQFVP